MRTSAEPALVERSSPTGSMSDGTPSPFTSDRKRATESVDTPRRRSVAGFALSSEARSSLRQRPCAAPKTKSLSCTIGPPNPPPS